MECSTTSLAVIIIILLVWIVMVHLKSKHDGEKDAKDAKDARDARNATDATSATGGKTRETMCGGYDQLCCCNGNETIVDGERFKETLVTAVDPRMITDSILSQVTMGR